MKSPWLSSGSAVAELMSTGWTVSPFLPVPTHAERAAETVFPRSCRPSAEQIEACGAPSVNLEADKKVVRLLETSEGRKKQLDTELSP